MSTESNQNKAVAIPADWLRPGAIIPFTLDNFRVLLDAVRATTTPSAMQPTSSASSADERAKFERYMQDDCFRDLQELTINANGNYDDLDVQNLWHSWRTAVAQTAPTSQVIVPPVVQAPTNEQLRKVLHKYSRYLGSGHHSDTEFASLQDVMAFAREVMTLAAPIVATVPSEQKPVVGISRDGSHFYLIRKRDDGSDWPTDTVFYAAPSPTEQASDVRNAALEEAANIAELCHGHSYSENVRINNIALRIRALKSATPADKGNAPAEAKS